ncbi:uncharacterized protein [Thunnus thynnus]|uniref:uncharacterized protein isoform X1 n=1 Tax=Thunnus thynnus TaxID=8237 RepID=UPI003528AA48
MKTLVILSLGLAVALGLPVLVPDVVQKPVLTEEEKSPLLGDSVPVQGHVVVEDPAPQVRLGSIEQQEKVAPDTDQSPLNVQVKKDSILEQEVEVKPEDKVDSELKTEEEVKVEGDVKVDPKAKADTEVHLNPEVMAELEVKVKPEDKVDSELKTEEEVKMEGDVKVDPKAKADTEVHMNPEDMAELEVKLKPEDKVDPELNVDQDLKVESEVKVEPDVQWEPEVKPQEVQEEIQMEMNHDEETETGLEIEERHIDMEGRNEMDDDNMFEEQLSDTEQGLMGRSNNVLDEKPIMELEPETREEHFLDQQVMPGSAIMDEGPALDIMGQQIQPLGHYFPNEEAVMGMELAKQRNSDYLMMEGAGNEFVREEESPMDGMPLFEEPAMEDSPLLDEGVQNGVVPERENRTLLRQEIGNPVERRSAKATRQCSCPGVVLERKCYQFFRGPKRASDAEYFCQTLSPGGHLASITSQYIHREVMNLMWRQNGAYTRSWIGGLRYLETGRFIWLDGSPWSYADWLSGEPNDTANVEDCLEVLSFGNGKFNDFTCWEPQAFICSFPY